MIKNPILPGFNPDPSICRVGDDYYIATSTFEWYPGVQIHHSKDLANWTLVKRPLERQCQLDMRGNPDSCGVWAPCLSYADGLFWLVYTDVKRLDGNFKDAHNYIVTAPDIAGPWSDPIYANSSGFDPSLFHDDDGRKWFVNVLWNHRSDSVGGSPKHLAFAGILLQEYDHNAGKLIGDITNISSGSPHGLIEAPHLFKRNGYYYLTVAEGGTGYQHTVTMLRSRNLAGPYELHPNMFLMTSKDDPAAALQRAGHGQIVETPDGLIYHTHLCSRPLETNENVTARRSPLGRETGLQKCVWKEDDWLYLENGGLVPELEVAPPDGKAETDALQPVCRRFDSTELPLEFQWLRSPFPERLFSCTGQGLVLHARESIGSWFEQSLVGRRQEHHSFRAETAVEFAPLTIQQSAGLAHYYNRGKFHLMGVAWHETHGRILTILSCPGDWPDGRLEFPLQEVVQLPERGTVQLAMEVNREQLQFFYRLSDEVDWQPVGPVLDASVISDEGGRGEHASFTGAFVAMAAFDTSGSALDARYSHFNYLPRD
ncbi:MAG: glycoside hydrolase family 43 protein [Rhizobiaceae bacterium]